MSREHEADLIERILASTQTEAAVTIKELMLLRRERYRDKLEAGEDPLARGGAKECKYLLKLLG